MFLLMLLLLISIGNILVPKDFDVLTEKSAELE